MSTEVVAISQLKGGLAAVVIFEEKKNITFIKPLTRLIDIHPPQGTTYEAMVSTTLPVALALIHDGVRWRWIVAAEALPSVLYPSIGVALVLLDAPLDALRRGVVP